MSAVFPASRLQSRSALARWDSLLIILTFAQGAALLIWPSIALFAIVVWWSSNTISHNFIHRPFFRQRLNNSGFSIMLTILLGFPQSLWKQRHLAHHAGARHRLRLTGLLIVEFALTSAQWIALVWLEPALAGTTVLPGRALGLALCQIHGHFEHKGATRSNYGRLYNLLFLNDGFHVEHHARPGAHWRELPSHRSSQSIGSRWPAVLRWLEFFDLCGLERMVLRSPALQKFMVNRHADALRKLLAFTPTPRSVAIVGGGLFPRTALVFQKVLPKAGLTLIDMSDAHLETARSFLGSRATYVNRRFDAAQQADDDLIIIPLALLGDREAIYRNPPASYVLIHDWIWRRRGHSTIVSWFLLKRLNLVIR